MEFAESNELPDGAIIVGASVPQHHKFGEEERICYECGGPCYVSTINAFRTNVKFKCMDCAAKDPETYDAIVTPEDLRQVMELTGISNPEVAKAYIRVLVERERRKHF